MPKSTTRHVRCKAATTAKSALPSRTALEAAWQAAFASPPCAQDAASAGRPSAPLPQQEAAHGGLSPEVEAYLASLLPKPRGRGPQAEPAPVRRLKPGTRLLRAWRGKTYTVTVADPGFLYDGKTYGSLSVIARKITGTPWSGPVFFGLKKAKAVGDGA